MVGPVDPNDYLGGDSSGSGSAFDARELSLLQGLDLTVEEFQALSIFKAKLEFIQNNEISYLVLGDFSEYPKRRLNLVCSRLNGKKNTSAKTLIKLPQFEELDDVSVKAKQSNLETYLQFLSVAINVSAIVFVSEGRNAGSAVELGRITATEMDPNQHQYFKKSYLAVRDYSDLSPEDIHRDHPSYDDLISNQGNEAMLTNPRPYSSPQESMFEIFKRNGRYWEWGNRRSLWEVADEIHRIVADQNN